MRWQAILVLALAVPLTAEPLDRIAVTLGRYVIAESDVVRNLHCAAFIDDRAVDLSGAQKREAAGRLVDEYLILQDAATSRATLPDAAAAEPLLTPIRARFSSDTAFHAALEYAQITENDLREHLLSGLRLLHYTETRFRPEVQVSDDDLRAAYSKLKSGKTFEAVRPQLEQLLTGQRTLEALDNWLVMARQEARIIYRNAVFS